MYCKMYYHGLPFHVKKVFIIPLLRVPHVFKEKQGLAHAFSHMSSPWPYSLSGRKRLPIQQKSPNIGHKNYLLGGICFIIDSRAFYYNRLHR